MIIECKSCSRKFIVKDQDIPAKGRNVQCGYCSTTWHQMPASTTLAKSVKKVQADKKTTKIQKDTSVEEVKASDGKTYRFLGSQWAEILPSGKSGLFAKKEIGKELNRLTGRKNTQIKKKKIKKEVDPSSVRLNNNRKLPDIYQPREGMGFFGFVFLIIIVGFSIVGVLKTFENDLLNTFPQTEYIFQILDEQLEFLAETVKNMIVIVKDLISSY
tara:strand:- start:324 stop:968 length:645 start_codon:yes stop_codon:yes gene_type:complete